MKYSRIILVIMLAGAFGMTIFASDIMGYISNVIAERNQEKAASVR